MAGDEIGTPGFVVLLIACTARPAVSVTARVHSVTGESRGLAARDIGGFNNEPLFSFLTRNHVVVVHIPNRPCNDCNDLDVRRPVG